MNFSFLFFICENLFVNLFICKYGWLFFGGVGDIVIDVISGVVWGEEIFDIQIFYLYLNKTEFVEKNLYVKELKVLCSYISKLVVLRNIWILINYYIVK